MAAWRDAAAVLCALCLHTSAYSAPTTLLTRFCRHCLLVIWNKTKHLILDQKVTEKLQGLGLLCRITTSLDLPAASHPERRHQKRCERKQARLACTDLRFQRSVTRPHRTPEKLRDVGDHRVLIFRKSSRTPLSSYPCYRANRVFMEGGKTRSRGVCLHQWCLVPECYCCAQTLFSAGGVYHHQVPTLLSTEVTCIDPARRCLHPSHRQHQR